MQRYNPLFILSISGPRRPEVLTAWRSYDAARAEAERLLAGMSLALHGDEISITNSGLTVWGPKAVR